MLKVFLNICFTFNKQNEKKKIKFKFKTIVKHIVCNVCEKNINLWYKGGGHKPF